MTETRMICAQQSPQKAQGGSSDANPESILRKSVICLLVCALLVLASCTTYRTEPPKAISAVPLLASFRPEKTTRQELEKEWGAPSATLQQGRVMFYRLDGNGDRLRFSEEAGAWKHSHHSLVLVFNQAGVLEKSSLIRVR